MKRRGFIGKAAAIGSAPLLSACGGGGDAPAPAPTPAPTPAPVVGPAWPNFAHDPQHTAVSAVATQNLARAIWSTPVDLAPQYSSSGSLLIHYGSPVITARNTVVIPVKIGVTSGFRVEGHIGSTGALLWTLETGYVLPPHGSWKPSYNVGLTPQGRVVAPASGGRIIVRDSADLAASTTQTFTFYGTATYAANAAACDAAISICTPITVDAQGTTFFGFHVNGTNPAGLVGGIARVAADGAGAWISAATAAGDSNMAHAAFQSAPALSPDGSTVYCVVCSAPATGVVQNGYLVALDTATLATRQSRRLLDPKSGLPARVSEFSSSSTAVAPNGHVYIGVLENPFPSHNLRGWMLHFDAQLAGNFVPGGFGWDVTPTIIASTMVPSYNGTSAHLLALKYNNYAGIGTGDGQNKLAVLDPGASMTDPISGIQQMDEVLTIVGPTHETGTSGPVYEWCINTMAADPARQSIIANSEDGILYRWSLVTNALTQSLRLGDPLGAAYTPTAVGPDGVVYAVNNARLIAVGQ